MVKFQVDVVRCAERFPTVKTWRFDVRSQAPRTKELRFGISAPVKTTAQLTSPSTQKSIYDGLRQATLIAVKESTFRKTVHSVHDSHLTHVVIRFPETTAQCLVTYLPVTVPKNFTHV